MTLPADISRCLGETSGQTCPHRDTCRRYTEPAVTPGWSWYIHPQIPGPCIYHMPAPPADGGAPAGGQSPGSEAP